jgi:protein gp37
MSSHSKIEWTDATWNPIRGCARVSEGCRHCYAERQAIRQSKPGQPYHNLVAIKKVLVDPGASYDTLREPRWTGAVQFDPEALKLPMKWKKPRRIFVNSMGDLFHEKVHAGWIHSVIAVMAVCRQHTFQILTKRADVMCAFLSQHYPDMAKFPYIWWGVSVENQPTADERIPYLLRTPAAVRWVSYEPALAPINLQAVKDGNNFIDTLGGIRSIRPCLDWVVCGGESGPNAREFNIEWARHLRETCLGARVPFFMKQLGNYPYSTRREDSPFWGQLCDENQTTLQQWAMYFRGKHGDPAEWPEDLRVREYPEGK